MSIKICLVALAALCLVPCVAAQESTYNVTDFLQLWGYKYDLYTSNTADGYVLGLQRIYSTTGSTLGHVILQHGLLDTAATWLLNDPEESLGYMLADAGYDVWLANSRGNTYSPCSNYSWDWDQHAQFDVPAVIQTVQSVTGSKSVYFIGHSQGATIGVAAFSTQPKVAANVKLFIALAPVTYLASERSTLLSTLASLHVDQLLLALPDGPMILTPQLLSHFLGLACTVTPSLCNNILNSLFGSDSNLNMSRMDVYTGHWPDQTSTRNMAHWIQNARSGAFASLSGANYQPSSIACPVAVFGGTQDFLADSVDVNTLVAAMGSKVVYKNLGLNYGHMDFVWGQNANTNVYQFVIALLQKYK